MTNEQQYIHDRIAELKTLVAEGLEQNRIDVTERSQRLIESFLENTISSYKAMNEPTYFDNKGLNKIDNGWGAVGEKLDHDNIAGHKVWDGEPVLEVKGAPFDEKLDSQKPVERWRPEYGMKYWVVEDIEEIESFFWEDQEFDSVKWNSYNCFRTEQEALAARDRVKKALKGE